MELTLTLEHRFYRTPDGVIWTHRSFDRHFWDRYLAVFDHVHIVARVGEVAESAPTWKPASRPEVSFVEIPHYLGPWQYLARMQAVNQAARRGAVLGRAVILRLPSYVGSLVLPVYERARHPVAVEVVSDPYDVFAPGSVKNLLRPVFRSWFTRRLQQQCQKAAATAYVTEKALQVRYPPAPGAYTTHYSSVSLPGSALVSQPHTFAAEQKRFTLMMVGTLAQLYKAPDVLINAVGRCVNEGLDLKLVMVGDGKHLPELQQQAAELGLGERVEFLGQLPAGAAVFEALDQADLFVLPSHQEGLPRAMIEAMARGLPCIGSTVGGFPELLLPDEMVTPGDAVGLSRKIREVVSDPARMTRMAARNLEKAKDYCEEVLTARRLDFYRHIQQLTEDWLKTHPVV